MEAKLETNEVKVMIDNTKAEILDAIQSLQSALAPGYIVTDCDVNIGTIELLGGGKQVYIEGVDITVEVATKEG